MNRYIRIYFVILTLACLILLPSCGNLTNGSASSAVKTYRIETAVDYHFDNRERLKIDVRFPKIVSELSFADELNKILKEDFPNMGENLAQRWSTADGHPDTWYQYDYVAFDTEGICSLSILETISSVKEDKIFIKRVYAYTFSSEMNAVLDKRYFALQDIPENVPEELAANHYLYIISSQFDKLSEIYGENESLKISAENERDNFEEGYFVKDYVIHEISTLSEDDLIKSTYGFTDENILKADIIKYQLTDYAVVKVDLSMTWSQEALSKGPQIDDGRYNRFFLCGTNNGDTTWKIYEVYWE